MKVPHVLLLFLVSAVAVSAKMRTFSSRSAHGHSSLGIYAKLQARIVSDTTTSGPTHTIRRSVKPAKRNFSKRDGYSTTAIYAAIKHCLPVVHAGVANIKRHCSENTAPEVLIPALQRDFQPILAALRGALSQIDNSPIAATPSGGYTSPPTVFAICKLIIELITCISSVFPVITGVIKIEIFRNGPGDILCQINSTITQIISSVHAKFPTTMGSLSHIGRDIWGPMRDFDFGFDEISKMFNF